MGEPRMDLSSDDFARLADRVVGEATRYLAGLDARSIRPPSTGEETLALFAGPLPEKGMGESAFDDLPADRHPADSGRELT